MLNWKIFRCNLTAVPEISLAMKITVIVLSIKLSKLLIILGTSIIHYCVSNKNLQVAIKGSTSSSVDQEISALHCKIGLKESSARMVPFSLPGFVFP